jgi:transporter family-2 protein
MNKAGGMLIGGLVAVMVTLNGVLSQYTNIYLATFIIHLIGLFTIGSYLLIRRHKRIKKGNIPIYLFMGGAVGIILVTLNNICFNNLGVSLTLSIGLLGQLILSALVDHFGLLNMPIEKFEVKKLPGFAMIITGIIIMMFL